MALGHAVSQIQVLADTASNDPSLIESAERTSKLEPSTWLAILPSGRLSAAAMLWLAFRQARQIQRHAGLSATVDVAGGQGPLAQIARAR